MPINRLDAHLKRAQLGDCGVTCDRVDDQSLGYASGLPQTLWGEALRHTTWLKNQTATCALDGRMPFKALYRTTPDLLEAHP